MSTSVYSQELHLPFNMTTVIEDNHQQEEQVEVEIDQKLITKVASNNNNNGDDNSNINNGDDKNISSKGNINGEIAAMSRKEKRKAMKKMKRKQVRKEIAVKEREEEQARLNDPEEQTRLARLEQEEAERMAKERVQFEERERQFLQALELKKKQEEEEAERLKLLEDSRKEANNENGKEEDEDDGWEYVEEGPAEIIWKGNEIIVKKKKVRVPKKPLDTKKEQEGERPISNPLAPQSEVFEDYRNAQDVLESVAQQVPNFGTEQDKEHCPFHLKTGVCRFGARCSRVHFYPDKACTLLLKNMYHGPGLAWEQDEGLEYTEEEAERSFEDFYEDVHTEFLKYGEIVNFKVCRNGSPHLRGNVYVHYKSLESATLAYQSINGRYFAGKQLTCEFVNLTRWRVAICGEYIKSRLKTCSRGSACNFIHCFRNPGGDYEWADWDKPAPRYWLNSMAALFGCSSDRITDDVSPSSYHSRKSRSRGLASSHRKSFSNEDGVHKRRSLWRHSEDDREDNSLAEEMQRRTNTHQDYLCIKNRETGGTDDKRSSVGIKRSMEKRRESDPTKQDRKSGKDDALSAKDEYIERGVSDRYHDHKNRSSSGQKRKDNKFDLGDNSFAGKHQDTLPKQKGKRFPQETKEADSSNIESHCNSTDSEEDKRHSNSKKNSSRIECEPDLSSSVSDESSLSRVEESKQMNRRNSPRFKRKRSVEEIGSDEVSSECDEDGQYKHIEKSLRSVKHNSETFEGGGRIGREEKRPRKSSRLNHQSATETESESDEAKRHRHSKKHSRQSKKYADSPDSAFEEDRRGRYRNRPKKSRRKSSRSHNESDFADLDRNGERIVVGHHGHRIIKEPSLSKVGRGLKSDDEAIVSSGEAGVELEKACRYAALKKLEEMRKHKTQAACNIEIVEGLKICADENIVADGVNVNRISEESGSIELETSGASVKRRRI